MKINRNNYESFFVDYLDGNLDEKLIDDFIEFLQQNPDLKEELSLIENIPLEAEIVSFDKKDQLFKEKYDLEEVFNETAIAALEGDISEREIKEFEKYLAANPEKQKEVRLFQLTKLNPDESLVFPSKEKLTRKSGGRKLFLWATRIAAVFVLALSVYIFTNRPANKVLTQNPVLEITDNAPEKQQNIREKISLPEKTDKKTSSPVNKKESTKTEIKKTETKTETPKSLRESTKGRLEKDDLALLRREVETPPQLASLSPVVYTGTTNPGLAQININLPESEEYLDDEKYFVDMVKEKTGIQNINLSKITQAGLNAMSNISKEKFRFNTDEQGKLTKINYDSGFLAFSIPTTKKESND